MAPSFSKADRAEILLAIGQDHVLAHAVCFGHRHSHPTPPFHHEIIKDWHSTRPNVLTLAFRDSAKSTIGEEATALEACFQHIHNALILGESEQRAVERLRAIKHEIETNEVLQLLFEIGPGAIWTEAKVTLSNGVMLQAYGRGQSLRGVKHLEHRPDWLFMDDLEDDVSVATPEARDKTRTWYGSTVVPAMDPGGRKRMGATPLHPEALAPTLAKAASWYSKTYPVIHKDSTGRIVSTWASRYSVEWVEKKREELNDLGKPDIYVQEYLCQATNPATQVFTPEMIRVVPQLRSWHAVYAMYDPARTTNKKSATTGKVVWSWVGRKLVIWDAFAKKLMPGEIIDDIFAVEEEYHPVAIGVEETGLNEWLMQPIRAQQKARGQVLPMRALHAPRGKLDFIRGLQPYFRAGEVEFARDLPELRAQLLGFPSGDIDAPNALAYALKMKLGVPVYEEFNVEHMAEDLRPAKAPLWLAVNSDGKVTTAVLCQLSYGQLLILADWLHEGDPGAELADIIQEASVETPFRRVGDGKLPDPRVSRETLRCVAPQSHWGLYDLIGLRPAAKRIPVDLSRGGAPLQGREELRRMLRARVHGMATVRVSNRATWTLRALAGGFSRLVDASEPEENSYAVLMTGVEAFAAMLRGAGVQNENNINWQTAPDGRRYISARG